MRPVQTPLSIPLATGNVPHAETASANSMPSSPTVSNNDPVLSDPPRQTPDNCHAGGNDTCPAAKSYP